MNCEKVFPYHIRLLSEMLNTGPWSRLPLTVRWLRPDLKGDIDFPRDKQPPIHMPVLYGQVKSVKLKKKKMANSDNSSEQLENPPSPASICGICFDTVSQDSQVQCLNPKCQSVYHIVCLGDHFRQSANESRAYFLPLDGQCKVCDIYMLWGDIIRKKKGCYQQSEIVVSSQQAEPDSE